MAEISVYAIKNSINNLILFSKQSINSLLWKYCINLVDSKLKHQKIIKYYNLMHVNNKIIFKWLNYMNINKDNLINILKE